MTQHSRTSPTLMLPILFSLYIYFIIYIYIYIYTHTHIYIYIYIYFFNYFYVFIYIFNFYIFFFLNEQLIFELNYKTILDFNPAKKKNTGQTKTTKAIR